MEDQDHSSTESTGVGAPDWTGDPDAVTAWNAGRAGSDPLPFDAAHAYRATVLPLSALLCQVEAAYEHGGEEWMETEQAFHILGSGTITTPQALLLSMARQLADAGDSLSRAILQRHAQEERGRRERHRVQAQLQEEAIRAMGEEIRRTGVVPGAETPQESGEPPVPLSNLEEWPYKSVKESLSVTLEEITGHLEPFFALGHLVARRNNQIHSDAAVSLDLAATLVVLGDAWSNVRGASEGYPEEKRTDLPGGPSPADLWNHFNARLLPLFALASECGGSFTSHSREDGAALAGSVALGLMALEEALAAADYTTQITRYCNQLDKLHKERGARQEGEK